MNSKTTKIDSVADDATQLAQTFTPTVFAAGGLIWRRGDGDRLELLMIHRPGYDDWSFPKGKREPGETDEDCAVREVAEETGFTCRLGPELATCFYVDRNGRFKQVRYWVMTLESTEPDGADDEVDIMMWAPIESVPGRLTYDRDRPVFDSFCSLVVCGGL